MDYKKIKVNRKWITKKSCWFSIEGEVNAVKKSSQTLNWNAQQRESNLLTESSLVKLFPRTNKVAGFLDSDYKSDLLGKR